MKNNELTLHQTQNCHGGTVRIFSHESTMTHSTMRFSLFTPPLPLSAQSPALVLFLSGLTCTEDNFTTKGNAYQKASELGLCILVPDTSPRGNDVPDDDAYDLGQGAGFYLDATEQPWSSHFQMESYLIQELIPKVEAYFEIGGDNRRAITGHSMGGHGALTLYFKYPNTFVSCSAFAPIVAPTQVPWGQKAFTHYLGTNQDTWLAHDACVLATKAPHAKNNNPILIDQGLADSFLQRELQPERFEQACIQSGQKLSLRQHQGYDHSYFFIQSFIDEHLLWHKGFLEPQEQ